MFSTNLVPGQGFVKLTIWEPKSGVASSGRPVSTGYANTGLFLYGVVTDAPQKEIEAWKQNSHPISHEIIEYGAVRRAKAADYLVSDDGRCFYVQGLKNPGGLNVSLVYYVEERAGVNGKAFNGTAGGNLEVGETDQSTTAGSGRSGVQ